MLAVNGSTIHVVDRGQGPPILFIHGNPDSSAMWTDVISGLCGQYRCIAIDLPGYGHSVAAPDFDFSPQGQADFVDATVRALGISEPIHLVAHDYGGYFGLSWMAAHPEKVKRVAVTNTTYTTTYKWHFWARIWRTPILGELSMILMSRPMFRMELKRGSKKLSREHIDATYDLLTPKVKRTTLKLYRTARSESLIGWEDKYLAAARKMPVLVLWGDDDPFIPGTFAESFNAQRVVHYPGAGHWLPAVESQKMADELKAFFAT